MSKLKDLGKDLDPALLSIEAASATMGRPTAEPVIAQQDHPTMQRLIDACMAYKYMELNGHIIRVIDDSKFPNGERFPEILRIIDTITTLESITSYDQDDAIVAYLETRQMIRKARALYKNVRPALWILDTLGTKRWRVVMGDAKHGKKQTHIQKVSGAERTVTVGRTRGPNLMDRIRGPR